MNKHSPLIIPINAVFYNPEQINLSDNGRKIEKE